MRVYLDSCFVVRLYLRLEHSEKAVAKVLTCQSRPVITWLSELETINAFERYVFETGKGSVYHFSRESVAVAQASFREDLASGDVYDFATVELPPLRRHFEALALRHTARHGFRTYDLLHVASAITLGCGAFWSFDGKAIHLAQLQGLETN